MKSLRNYLAAEYGGNGAFARHLWHLAAYHCGFYRPVERERGAAVRIVFICKGNICRSPYAEVKARQMGISAVSAGLDTTPGKPAYERAAQVAATRGVDLSAHRTQLFSDIQLQPTDVLVVMEPGHVPEAATIAKVGTKSIQVLGALASPPRPYLQDPFGRSTEYFNRCYDSIDNALTRLHSLLGQHGR